MTPKPEIYIAGDHQGFELKNILRDWLKQEDYTITDLGPDVLDTNDDYPDYGIKVAEAVAQKPAERLGIVICASGVGMAVAADKVKGIRAGLIHHPAIARAARQDDNLNVLALGSAYITPEEAKEVVEAWLTTPFSGQDRHQRRLDKIHQYEQV